VTNINTLLDRMLAAAIIGYGCHSMLSSFYAIALTMCWQRLYFIY